MTSSALLLALSGLILTFAPEKITALLSPDADLAVIFIFQILGALYFSFGILNWMVRSGLIGGIYNRPVILANLAHFMIVGLGLIRIMISGSYLPRFFWIVTIVYVIFAIVFGLMLFTSPRRVKQQE